MYDVAIIGAGPAGSTLARLIGQSYKVLLVDKRPVSDSAAGFSPGKCCGGLLAPDGQKMLSQLGLGLPKSVLEEPQLFVVRAIDLPTGLERYYQRHYINMNRRRFDDWLLSLVPASVDVRTNCLLKSYSAEDPFFRLTLIQDGKIYIEKANILVGADGAISRVRFQDSPAISSPKKYFAIQEWVEAETNYSYFTSLFDREITDYYCWTIPKGKYLVIGAALPPRDQAAEKFKLLKRKIGRYGFQWGKTVWKEGGFLLRPGKRKHLSTGQKRIALIGEAAGWISPSSAEGISYAFKSALILAEVLRTTPDGFEARYDEETRALRRNIFLKNWKAYFIFNPTLRKILMQSGFQSLDIYKPCA